MIEFQNVASYVLELLRIFNPDLEKRPETCFLIGHFAIQSMYYDIVIFKLVNGLAGRSAAIDALEIFLANYLPYLLMLFLIACLFWPQENKRQNRQMVFLAITSALAARFLLKTAILFFYQRPRPYIALPSTHKLISSGVSESLQSFPSGHVIFFFALSAVVYSFNKKLGAFFFICSAIMGIARIFVGVHWPSDILGGAVLGILVGVVAKWLYVRFHDDSSIGYQKIQ